MPERGISCEAADEGEVETERLADLVVRGTVGEEEEEVLGLLLGSVLRGARVDEVKTGLIILFERMLSTVDILSELSPCS